MRILVISQYFYPENFRINDLVLELKKHGHEITVLTGKPNYPQGKYYEGYSFKGRDDEYWNDIPIYRVPLRARKTGSINLVRNYISFVWNANKGVKLLQDDFDIIYVFEVSPITVALPAIKLKKKKKIPIIMNVQDLWPENIIAITGINNSVINFFLNRLVNYIYKNIDLILTASPAFINKIRSRIENKDKVIYWPQYATISKKQIVSKDLFDKNKFNIVFTGNIGEAQGLEIVIDAAKRLKDTNVVFHLIGDGRNKQNLENKVIQNKLVENVKFYGQISETEIPNYLTQSDAALLILKSNPIFNMTVPAKLQTYLACGCPIIGCIEGISKEIIEKNQLGITCNTVSVEEFVKTCIEFKETKYEKNFYRDNAFKYSDKYFNKEKLISTLINYMEEIK